MLSLIEARLLLLTHTNHKCWYYKIRDEDVKMLYEMIVEYAEAVEDRDAKIKELKFKNIESYWIILWK